MSYDDPLGVQSMELLNRPQFAELEFFKPSLEAATPDQLFVPEVVEDELLPLLRRSRLILLGGHRETDKLLFAKQLAWHLKEDPPAGTELVVRQWQPSTSVLHVSSALDRAQEPTIFLFPGLEPHHLGGYDLSRFLEDLGRRKHYAILTTHSPLDRWSAGPDMEKALWVDVDRRLLTDSFLAQDLVLRLTEMADDLPEGLAWSRTASANTRLIGQVEVEEAAASLDTPTRIRSFVVALTTRDKIDEAGVKDLLDELADERLAVHHWFRSLPSRDQVLALGLALFDGLLDDQTFSSIEILMQQAWREWDPALGHFDYNDLDRVRTYFRGFDADRHTVRIECISDACRRYLLEIGWILLRRRVCAAIPVLESLVKRSPRRSRPSRRLAEVTGSGDSSNNDDAESQSDTEPSGEDDERDADDDSGYGDGSDAAEPDRSARDGLTEAEISASRWLRSGRWRDLFGNNLRNGLMRDRLAQTISEIGMISTDAVEPVLLQLASHPKASPRYLVADAVARWRDLDPGGDGDRRLARLLSAWRSESAAKQLAQLRRKEAKKARPFMRVRTTIALALSRASLYDPPSQLSADLCTLFQKLLRDRSRPVRKVLREETVPVLVQSHLRQLVSILWDQVAPSRDLLVSTASGIASAHYLRPQETRQILDSWLEKARRMETTTQEKRRHRGHALAVIAYVYGLLTPEPPGRRVPGSFSADDIFGVLRTLLAEEQSPIARRAALLALILQANADFDTVAPYVQDTVNELALEERGQVVAQLVDLYLQQRRDMGRMSSIGFVEPDEYRTLSHGTYGLWVETERPPTRLETMLKVWLDDGSRPVALQLAVECFDALGKTWIETVERELRSQVPVETEPEAEDEPEVEEKRPASLRSLSFSAWLATLWVLFVSWERWNVVQTALPEVLRRLGKRETHRIRLLLELWNRGKPRWRRLVEPDTLRRLANVPEKDGLRVIERLTPANPTLARQLLVTVWVHSLRWPLLTLALALVLLIGLTAAF